MEKDLILSVDIGTTNLKAGVVDEKGNILSLYRKETPIERDNEGKAEHDPDTLFNAFVEAAGEAAKGFEDRISLIVPSSYMFGLIPIDDKLNPLMGIMTLLDLRARETYEELLERIDVKEVYRRTGFTPTFHAPLFKIYWLKKKRSDIFNKTRFFLSSKDFILLKLLGEPFTEPSLSSATAYMNVNTLEWDDYVLDILGVSKEKLPPIMPSDKILADLPEQSKKLLGLTKDVKVLTGVYDGGAVGIGIGAFEEEVGAINIGTTGMFRVAYPEPVFDKEEAMRLQTYYLSSGKWFIGAAINNAGVVLKWLRDNIFNMPYEELTHEASKEDSSNLFFLPYLTGERDKEIGNIASGVFFGLKNIHTKGHMIRAAMEGVAFSLRMIYEALKDNNIKIREIRAGGGATNSPFWMEIFASTLGLPIKVSKVEEPALVGSAILGYYVLGRYKDLSEATKEMVSVENVYMPDEKEINYYEKKFQFFKKLSRELKSLFEAHSKL
ncbi:gluconokinase [Caldanaerobacter subterraneus subsp. tengcongensis MB4]|uniref:Sugar (Pentulose and hexulose) kinases n=1 Tax=Caldanaerobacter subterraneus subsp. tengcongensis (strain DSM 15242 / JCM 11007 / NBRC 100824 / MB4) TaxID=273068 RepID=Q8R8Q3_CALS4|nr:gluconokinase [Caldanaerobacter subterraneus]AAM25121.1 Sugar (pentulose and hexulose) kinases [Caldanaerobacter subterraneus subsp. tengcongensis MB4]MCS3915287.1 gluconokinase [Caldanaerobacter subterraneus subsp. tengcongensis MB4]